MIDEGYIKFRSRWQKSPPLDNPEIDELIRWRRPLYATGLIGYVADCRVGYGNLSSRIAVPGQFVISGTQTGHLGDLGRKHFALVTACDIEANLVESKGPVEASSESMTHAAIYALDPRFLAVVHVHSEELWLRLIERAPTTVEGIGYGTPQMAQDLLRLFHETEFRQTGVAVMAGHRGGLISTGNSVREAAERMLALNDAMAT